MVNELGLPQQLARRSYQDWLSWSNYLCQIHWEEIKARPTLAGEIIVTQMHKLGLRNPSEQSSASIAAAAEHGQSVTSLNATHMTHTFLAVKAQSFFQGAYIAGACEARGYNRRR